MRGKTNGHCIKDCISDQYNTGLRFPNRGCVLPCVLYLLPLEVYHNRDNTQTGCNFKDSYRTDRQNTYAGQRPDQITNQGQNFQTARKEKVVALLFQQQTIKYLHELHNGNDHMF